MYPPPKHVLATPGDETVSHPVFFHRGSHRSPDSECWLFHGVGSLKPTDGDRMVTSFWLFFLAFVEGVKLLLVILFLSGLEK